MSLSFHTMLILIISYYYFSMRRALKNFTSDKLKETIKTVKCLFLTEMLIMVLSLFYGITLRVISEYGLFCSISAKFNFVTSLSILSGIV